MNPTTKKIYQLIIIGGLGILLLILSLATPVVLSTSDFSIYNTNWNGCSTLGIRAYKADKLQPTLYIDQNELTITQQSFIEYQTNPNQTTLIILGPKETFTTQELTYLQNFLTHGGRLFIADDFGTGNQILTYLNTTTRFTNHLLLDLTYTKNASYTHLHTTPTTTNPFTTNTTTLLLNYPTTLTTTNTPTYLKSSPLSWLDTTPNGHYDTTEPHGPFPLLTIEPYQQGELILCSTPSILINSMKQHHDNQQFRTNLFTYLFNDRTTIIFDESHRAISAPLQISYYFPSTISLPIKIIILLVVVTLFITWFTPLPQTILTWIEHLITKKQKNPIKTSTDAMVEDLIARHPTWNRQQLHDFIKRMEHP